MDSSNSDKELPPLIDRPGPYGQSYRKGLDPRWSHTFQRFAEKLDDDDFLDLWEIMRDCYDQGAREQSDDPDRLPTNPYNGDPPQRPNKG